MKKSITSRIASMTVARMVVSMLAMAQFAVLPASAKDIRIDQKAWSRMDHNQWVVLQAGDRLLLKRGGVYSGVLKVTGRGTADHRITVDAYGKGQKPRMVAPKDSLYAVLVKNSDYLTVQNLDITNRGEERLAGRTGIKLSCDDYGVRRGITLRSLLVHDVNGSLIKHSGEGSGILLENKWEHTPSAYDSLLIEDCTLRRCERNGIIWHANSDRKRWFPNRHVVVRKCLVDQVPGDGIVPIGCDGALVEYNKMTDSPDIMPEREAAAGFWPWSCDNTIIQYNEVSGHKAHWDGQAFDCDYNCRNTTIRYNYSHDNYGGFLLVCSSKIDGFNMGNVGSVVEYNLSVNDGIRPYTVYTGKHFSPLIHVSGPCYNTLVAHNILYSDGKAPDDHDHNFVYSGQWDAYAESTYILDNIFYAATDTVGMDFTESRRNYVSGNRTLPLGAFDASRIPMKKVSIADGEAVVECIDGEKISSVF